MCSFHNGFSHPPFVQASFFSSLLFPDIASLVLKLAIPFYLHQCCTMCVASDISRRKPLGGNTLVLKGSNVGEMQLWQMTLLSFRSSVNIYIHKGTQQGLKALVVCMYQAISQWCNGKLSGNLQLEFFFFFFGVKSKLSAFSCKVLKSNGLSCMPVKG